MFRKLLPVALAFSFCACNGNGQTGNSTPDLSGDLNNQNSSTPAVSATPTGVPISTPTPSPSPVVTPTPTPKPTPIPTPTPSPSPSPSPSASPRPYSVGALIYQGDYTAYGDVEAITSILDAHGVTYDVYSSYEMDQLSVEKMAQYGTIIWPGGYAGQMSRSMNRETRNNLQKAVNEKGVSFVGFCAGAFIAVSPDTSWGLSVVKGNTLDYYHLENEGIPQAMVTLNFAGGTKRSVLWWGGPYLPNWPNGVIARYSDNQQAAIAQTWAGKGLVVLAGPHPEAPQDWRSKLGLRDSDGLDQDIAWAMFDAGLKQKPMKTLN
jgi:glutamine amidotransferase-like uncharacterized protein